MKTASTDVFPVEAGDTFEEFHADNLSDIGSDNKLSKTMLI